MAWTPSLDFEMIGTTKSGLTKIWDVKSGVLLGQVKWFANWRRYCFYPAGGTLYDAVCLRQIAGFCADQTEKRKAER
jgi:hypothetical protein